MKRNNKPLLFICIYSRTICFIYSRTISPPSTLKIIKHSRTVGIHTKYSQVVYIGGCSIQFFHTIKKSFAVYIKKDLIGQNSTKFDTKKENMTASYFSKLKYVFRCKPLYIMNFLTRHIGDFETIYKKRLIVVL